MGSFVKGLGEFVVREEVVSIDVSIIDNEGAVGMEDEGSSEEVKAVIVDVFRVLGFVDVDTVLHTEGISGTDDRVIGEVIFGVGRFSSALDSPHDEDVHLYPLFG